MLTIIDRFFLPMVDFDSILIYKFESISIGEFFLISRDFEFRAFWASGDFFKCPGMAKIRRINLIRNLLIKKFSP